MLPPPEPAPEPIVRRLDFPNGALAVITTFAGTTVVNWSASAGLGTFLDAVEWTVGPRTSPEVTMQRWGEPDMVEFQPTSPSPSDWLIDPESEVQLYRIDVSQTRSVAWQRLDKGSVIVGLGDVSGQLSLATDSLGKFIERTAMSSVDLGVMMSAVLRAVHGDVP